jgi:hypothetical protein
VALVHASALVQYRRACVRVIRVPATAFAVRVHEATNARRTSGGSWRWAVGAAVPAVASAATASTAATIDHGSRRRMRAS